MIVAIDGPAGAGKSSTAREVARRLGFRHLDSGAFYRALTRAALDADVPEASWGSLDAAALDRLEVRARPGPEGFRLLAGDRDVTAAIRDEEVTRRVSHMARVPAVRDWLLGRLRDAARGVDLVADGRDMGTVVFPHAEVKVFLVADPAERARRRLAERGVPAPDAATLGAETVRLLERDRLDSERTVAPLRQADDAVLVDTTALSFEEQVAKIVSLVRAGSGRDLEGAGPR